MIDLNKIRKYLPNSEASSVHPCTTPGKVQFHLMADKTKGPTDDVLDITGLFERLNKDDFFNKVKHSLELKVVRASIGETVLSILGSGRIVIRKVENEKDAQRILEHLAPYIRDSFLPQ